MYASLLLKIVPVRTRLRLAHKYLFPIERKFNVTKFIQYSNLSLNDQDISLIINYIKINVFNNDFPSFLTKTNFLELIGSDSTPEAVY